MLRPFPILLSLLLLAVSCREPVSVESFLRGEGPYVFTVDMTDSTAVYDLDLYTRIDARECPAQIPLAIIWKAPSGPSFTETVYLPVGRATSSFSHDAYAPYRAGVVPSDWGIWTLTISVPSAPEGLCGMGLVVKKQLWDTEN